MTGRGSPVVNSIVQALSGNSTSTAQSTAATTVATSTSNTHTTHSNPSTPGTPSSPTKTAGSRGVLSAALVMQPDIAVVASTGGFQVQPGSPTSTTYVPQLSDRFAPLTAPLSSSTTLPVGDSMPGIASVSVPSLPKSSLATDWGGSRVGLAGWLPELTTGLSQFALAEAAGDEAVADVIGTLAGEEMARALGSLSPGFIENGLSDAVSHSAIDALLRDQWMARSGIDSGRSVDALLRPGKDRAGRRGRFSGTLRPDCRDPKQASPRRSTVSASRRAFEQTTLRAPL